VSFFTSGSLFAMPPVVAFTFAQCWVGARSIAASDGMLVSYASCHVGMPLCSLFKFFTRFL
jgi:hypothetical protein